MPKKRIVHFLFYGIHEFQERRDMEGTSQENVSEE
jgi:hypothetical protein